jgi:hypothetical protein
VFETPHADLHEKYKCTRCNSLPRERALIAVVTEMFPNWRDLRIHECSPGSVSADKLWRECKAYTPSAYAPNVPRGQIIGDSLDRASSSNPTIFQIDDATRGLRAIYDEVLVSRKGAAKFPRWLGNLSHI